MKLLSRVDFQGNGFVTVGCTLSYGAHIDHKGATQGNFFYRVLWIHAYTVGRFVRKFLLSPLQLRERAQCVFSAVHSEQ